MDGMTAARGIERQMIGGQMDRSAGSDLRLARLVQTEVIPRLLLSRRLPDDARRPTGMHVETLTRLSLSRDPTAAAAQVAALREAGASVGALVNDLIGGAARRLGALWTADAIDFVDVAAATGRLSTIARTLGAGGPPPAQGAPAALLATLETERHGLGLSVFATVLRGAGWRVVEAAGADHAALLALAAAGGWRLIGLSVGRSDAGAPEAVAAAIAAMRAVVPDHDAIFAVGGPACLQDAGFAARVGADFGASEARDALGMVQALLSRTVETTTTV